MAKKKAAKKGQRKGEKGAKNKHEQAASKEPRNVNFNKKDT